MSAAAPTRPSGRPVRVLVVDDQPSFRGVVAQALRWVVVAAVVAATAVAGLGEFRRAAADGQPESWLSIPLVLVSVPVVAGLVVLGVWHSYARILEQAALLRDSRARVVAAADDARRRLERDLHDGAQQRLVTTSIPHRDGAPPSAPRSRCPVTVPGGCRCRAGAGGPAGSPGGVVGARAYAVPRERPA